MSSTYTAHITVMPLDNLLDPQGKAVMGGLSNLGLDGVKDVRIGKHITLNIDAESKESAEKLADEAARKLLSNQVMEQYHINVVE